MAIMEGQERRIVGGVDTHKDLHVAAVVDDQDRVLGTNSFATTRQGYRQMLAWMRSFGELQRIGVEATGKIAVGGQLRVVVRRQPRSGVLGKDRPASAQPRRRSRSQQRAAYHRHRTPTDRPENEGLCYSSDSRRAFQTRRHSSLEALPRPRGLHAHHSASQGDQRHTNRRLTNRRASAVLNTLLRAIGEPCFAMVWSVPWAGEGTLSITPRPRAS